MVASFIKKNEKIADIGTDHAYLPAFLITSGICNEAIASDVVTGPLENAKKIIKKENLEEKIKLFLSNGLDEYQKDDADVFIFAGMGGTLITELLEKTDWIKDEHIRFVFQPMSHCEDIIKFLCDNGFEIEEQKACLDNGKYYTAFSARYTGNISKHNKSFYYIGLLTKNITDESKEYIKKQYNKLKKKYDALKNNNKEFNKQEELKEILDEIIKECCI